MEARGKVLKEEQKGEKDQSSVGDLRFPPMRLFFLLMLPVCIHLQAKPSIN